MHVQLLLLSCFSRVRPHIRQPTRFPHPWDSPGKNTGVGCHFVLQCMKVQVNSLSGVRLTGTPWTAAQQAPPAMGFSRQEYWSGLPLPSPDACEGREFPYLPVNFVVNLQLLKKKKKNSPPPPKKLTKGRLFRKILFHLYTFLHIK